MSQSDEKALPREEMNKAWREADEKGAYMAMLKRLGVPEDQWEARWETLKAQAREEFQEEEYC